MEVALRTRLFIMTRKYISRVSFTAKLFYRLHLLLVQFSVS